MNDVDWSGVVFGMGVLTLGTVILIAVLMQVGSYLRARSARAEEKHHLELIQRYEELAAQIAAHQGAAAEGLDEVRTRVAEIERMLRAVE